jgi:hypothetical protein
MLSIPFLLPAFLLLQSTPAPDFAVRANGKPVPLHEFGGGAFGHVEIDKPVDVEIRTAFDVRWADVRPRSLGIQPSIGETHDVVRFRLSRPAPVTVEFNGEWKKVLHLFADAPEKNPPSQTGANVRYFGAGVHEAGVIELKDGETLYLAPGAWVKGVARSTGTKSVVIRGRGVLDGTDQPRANMILLDKTQNARIEGITLFNSKTWTAHLRSANGTRIEGLKILNYNTGTDGIDIVSSSDVMVENVFVRANDDCVVVKTRNDIDVRDITVRKAVFWNMPWGNAVEVGFELVAARVERIRFEDIDIIRTERGAALSIHNGDRAEVRDIVFENIRIENALHKLIDLAVVYGQYGADRPKSPEERTRRYMRGAWDGVLRCPSGELAECAKHRGTISGITFRDIDVVEGALPFSVIAGFDASHGVEDVRIENLRHEGRRIRDAAGAKLSIQHAKRVTVR